MSETEISPSPSPQAPSTCRRCRAVHHEDVVLVPASVFSEGFKAGLALLGIGLALVVVGVATGGSSGVIAALMPLAGLVLLGLTRRRISVLQCPRCGAVRRLSTTMVPQPITSKRSRVPRVLGILSIVAGSCFALWSGVLSQVENTTLLTDLDEAAEGAKIDRWRAGIEPQIATLKRTSTIFWGIVGVMSLALIAVGIAQVRYSTWARTASLVWALLALSALMAWIAIDARVESPTIQRVAEHFLQRGGSAVTDLPLRTVPLSAVIISSLAVPYPVLLTVLLSRKAVRQSLSDAA